MIVDINDPQLQPGAPMDSEWIGVDLDGTLAHYGPHWPGIYTIGAPIPAMKARVLRWLAEGREVRIFTARACTPEAIPPIIEWLALNGFPRLRITNVKDFAMAELWDDRAVAVEENTGRMLNPSRRGLA